MMLGGDDGRHDDGCEERLDLQGQMCFIPLDWIGIGRSLLVVGVGVRGALVSC